MIASAFNTGRMVAWFNSTGHFAIVDYEPLRLFLCQLNDILGQVNGLELCTLFRVAFAVDIIIIVIVIIIIVYADWLIFVPIAVLILTKIKTYVKHEFFKEYALLEIPDPLFFHLSQFDSDNQTNLDVFSLEQSGLALKNTLKNISHLFLK